MGATGESLAFLNLPEGSSWVASSEVTEALEGHLLPAYLAKARWFPNFSTRIEPKIIARLPFIKDSTYLVVIELQNHGRFLLPLRVDWSVDAVLDLDNSIVARLHQGDRKGLLRDVAADPTFIRNSWITFGAKLPLPARAPGWTSSQQTNSEASLRRLPPLFAQLMASSPTAPCWLTRTTSSSCTATSNPDKIRKLRWDNFLPRRRVFPIRQR